MHPAVVQTAISTRKAPKLAASSGFLNKGSLTFPSVKINVRRVRVGSARQGHKVIAASAPETWMAPDDFKSAALVSSREQYQEMYDRSINDPGGFWGDIAEEFFWETKWDPENVVKSNFNMDDGKVEATWFAGGKTNIAYNCLDRHVENGKGDDIAFYWEGNAIGEDSTLTFSQLKDEVCKTANYLKSVGVKKGDRVIIYMPMLNELPIAMLACARLGAIHSVVFGGFSAEALAQRISGSLSGTRPLRHPSRWPPFTLLRLASLLYCYDLERRFSPHTRS
ncbi:hypothetical protein CYMTET_57087 [Cymbomonas tetramitiformis]|uniref:acetate--CoA ligase n=1 Tax=Cymbomonas tetramitiformis TaxID=36881 RepID=A0AAE0EL74_9CHLO|nr:hypothetical protein CYMTET_57087 [Cymbomonas tetramitiformis]